LFGLTWPYEVGLPVVGGLISLLLITTMGPSPLKRRQPAHLLLGLWLLLPVVLTSFVYSPAFLKFLLVASPPLCLLLAVPIAQLAARGRPRWFGQALSGLMLTALLAASSLAITHYFTDKSLARDNYRGLIQFIKAVSGEQAAVILNAEGQQDVFGYYAERASLSVPVYPLPRRRPLDEGQTIIELNQITAGADKIYAVYWASRQADPQGVIERWLDNHLFKATDQWYGNVRLVSYAGQWPGMPKFQETRHYFRRDSGSEIQLSGLALASSLATPGDILRVGVQWRLAAPLDKAYTVFVQLLDSNHHLVAQRDAPLEPPTSDWPAGPSFEAAYGLFIEPGTPPGRHRLIAGLYDRQSGQRLAVVDSGTDFVVLAEIEVLRPATPLPLEAFTIQQPLAARVMGLKLWGVDVYKVGYRSAPDTPLKAGDPLHITAYWSKTEEFDSPWRDDADNENRRVGTRPTPTGNRLFSQEEQGGRDALDIRVTKVGGSPTGLELTYRLAGVDYPPAEWQAGEIVRAQYDLVLSGLEPGWYQLQLGLGGETLPVASRAFAVQ
jgi:hypothetical protein